ncbi:MAG TPA: hypothetical protein VK422_04830 [Pyrinomonadaceae bacterium]|nr:hypothetical protein [Pyrinomonadaceae bacterium]
MKKHAKQADVETKAGAGVGLAAFVDWQVVALVLAVKALALVFGVQAFMVEQDQSVAHPYGWLEIWNRWDAPHYLDIARDGYVGEGVQSRWIVFYPLFPWLVRAASFFLGDYLFSAFFVSGVASVAAGLFLYRLAALDETEATARAAVLLMLVFPTAYFLHIGYTESTFLALSLGSFLAARRRVWWAAGLLGALACMTRINGLALVPALALEAWGEYKESGGRWRRGWLWVLLAGSGFGVYLLVNWKVFGRPLAFLSMQEEYWSKSLTWPWVGAADAWNSAFWRGASDAVMVGWQEFLFLCLGLACAVWAWLRLRPSYALWVTLNWLLWSSTKFLLSVPRYTLVMFPLFILVARAGLKRPAWGAAYVVWSLLFMALFASRFVRGLWAF